MLFIKITYMSINYSNTTIIIYDLMVRECFVNSFCKILLRLSCVEGCKVPEIRILDTFVSYIGSVFISYIF